MKRNSRFNSTFLKGGKEESKSVINANGESSTLLIAVLAATWWN